MTTNNAKPISFFIYLWLLVIPLSYNFWGTDPALYHKFLLIDVSLIAFAGILLVCKNGVLKLNLPAVIFTGLYLVSILLAIVAVIANHINNADGWFVWLHLLVFPVFVLFLLVGGYADISNRKRIVEIISLLAAISVIISAGQYGFEIFNSGWSLGASDAIKATYAHKNIFAEIMFLTLPFTFYAFIITRKKWHALVVVVTLIMISLTLSRAVFSGILVAAIITGGVYAFANLTFYNRRYFVLAVVSLALLTAGFTYWLVAHTGTGHKIIVYYNHRDTVRERLDLWYATAQLIKANPVFGTGLGSWKILSMQFSMLGLRDYVTFFQQPHNDFLWIVSEQGFISFAFLALAWLYIIKLLLESINTKPTDIFNYCLLFALVGYFVYANFGFPRERGEHGIFLAFIVAIILNGKNAIPTIVLRRSMVFLSTVMLVVAAWWAGNKIMSQVYIRQALECREENDLQQEAVYLQKINATYCTLDGTATPVAWYRGMVLYAQHKNVEALTEFKEAVKENPYHAYSLANVGTCLSAIGDNNEAEHYFRKALTYSRGFPDAALNMCALKFNMGETDSAAYYLSMANDTLTDVRYTKFLNVITTALVKPMIDSASLHSETPLILNYKNLLSHPQWQKNILKKACLYSRPVKQQIWMDILWILKYQQNEPKLAEKYQNSLHLPEI